MSIYGRFTDLGKLMVLSDFVAHYLPNRYDYLSVMTAVIYGQGITPENSLVLASGNRVNSWGYDGGITPCDENDVVCNCNSPCPDEPNRYLTDSGFHQNFRDSHLPGGGNQIFHFWTGVATIGSAPPQRTFYDHDTIVTRYLYAYFGLQMFHETMQSQFKDAAGVSLADFSLTGRSMQLGRGIASGHVVPAEVSTWLYNNVSIHSSGAIRGLDERLYDYIGVGTDNESEFIEDIRPIARFPDFIVFPFDILSTFR